MSRKEIDSAYALIQGMQSADPKLSETIKIILRNLGALYKEQTRVRDTLSSISDPSGNPTGFTVELLYRSIQLSWAPADGALFYEIREGKFDNWDDASFVVRIGNTRVELPPRKTGTYTFLLKSYNVASEPSADHAYVDCVISPIPALDVTAQVIDNNVLLDWTEPDHPFEIIEYRITRNGTDIGYVDSSFFIYFEAASDVYTYGVRAIDLAGSESNEDTVTVHVSQPPDYEQEAVFLSQLAGTKVNCVATPGVVLVAIVNATETWDEHFISHGWNSPQDQIDAGFPYYAQPNLNSGYYEEIHDFGAVFDGVIVSISFQMALISDTVLVQPILSYSNDNVTYSTPEEEFTVYAPQVRYVKFRLAFTGADFNDLANISNILLVIQVKRVMDSGQITALAADSAGTQVNFRTPFRDVDSITLTPLSLTDRTAIYDFVDAPYPTGFKVLLFNTAGVRQDGTVSWKARGIL